MSASPRRLVSVAVVAIVATLGCRASKAKQSTAESPAPAVEEPAPAGTETAADRFPAADGWVRQNGLMHRAGPMPGTSHHGGARPRQALGVQLDDTDERDGGAVITYVYAGGPAQKS